MAALAVLLVTAPGGCEKQGPRNTEPAELRNSASSSAAQGASRPAAAPLRPYLDAKCFDVYAECPAAPGLAAISADGTRVALPDIGPPNDRDEFSLWVRIIDIKSGAQLAREPVMLLDDYDRDSYDSDAMDFTEATKARIQARVASVEQTLHRDGYTPLLDLGVVHIAEPGAPAPGTVRDGLRAAFDGNQLTVIDTRANDAVYCQRAIPELAAYVDEYETTCGPFPVAEIHVWASRAARVCAARISYIGDHSCSPDHSYMGWRAPIAP